MDYEKELNFIVDKIKEAFNLFYTTNISVKQKSKHDLVTDIDKNIENYLSEAIKNNFENDKILGEESSFNEKVSGRTWTIDPIDGTCNMANGIDLFGVQCSLIENNEIVVAAVFLPAFNYFFTATKNGGCYLNHQKVFVKQNLNINNAIISFGDYPHKNCTRLANWQNDAIKKILNVVAKIRMFGSAAIDLSFVASGKTDATVIITKNLWDIAPGILICKEAGAVLVDLSGNPYNEYSEGIIVAANAEIAKILVDAFTDKKNINPLMPNKNYDAVIFDFDGVILDTERYHYAAWKKVFEKYKITLQAEEYEPLKSTGESSIIEYCNKKYNLRLTEENKLAIAKKRNELFLKLSKDLSENDFVPGIKQYLDFLKDNHIKMAVASSSAAAKKQIEQFGLISYFDSIIDGNTKTQKKPHPEVFLKSAENLEVAPKNCLVFEDSLSGVEAARTGGFEVIYIGNNEIENVKTIKDFTYMI